MKQKQEIVRAAGGNEEDRLLVAGALDKLETCRTQDYMTHTRLLDLRERALVAQAVRQAGGEAVFWGGYPDAERAAAIFLPSYLTEEDVTTGESCPLAVLRASKHPADVLTHRDYLGALMGLGLARPVIGDILVREDGADLVVLEEVAEFLLLHFDRAGRRRITLERVPVADLRPAQAEEEEGSGTVASMRVDAVAALMFGLSRTAVQQEIARGMLFVNYAPCLKNETLLGEGDRITLRGRGRARITALGGQSRKGRQFFHYVRSR